MSLINFSDYIFAAHQFAFVITLVQSAVWKACKFRYLHG